MTYVACYMPSSKNPPEDKGGFETEDEAWDWVLNNFLCEDCQKEYKNFIDNVEEDYDNGIFASSFPACACEWIVCEESEL